MVEIEGGGRGGVGVGSRKDKDFLGEYTPMLQHPPSSGDTHWDKANQVTSQIHWLHFPPNLNVMDGAVSFRWRKRECYLCNVHGRPIS